MPATTPTTQPTGRAWNPRRPKQRTTAAKPAGTRPRTRTTRRRRDAERLAHDATAAYDQFVSTVPVMQDPVAQWVILALAAKRIRDTGARLEDVIRTVASSYGVELTNIDLDDAPGRA